MKLKCLKCGCDQAVKNGFVSGVQRYKCKKCGYQYTKTKPHGYGNREKRAVSILYISGLSMNTIARLVGVSVQTVSRWVKSFSSEITEEFPEMEKMKKVTLKEVVQSLQKTTEEEQKYEFFILSTRLPSGCGVKIFIDSPVYSENLAALQEKLEAESGFNG